MKVILARGAGFCLGVRRAFEIALDAARRGPVQTLGPLINNSQALDRLRARGVETLSPEAAEAVAPLTSDLPDLSSTPVDAGVVSSSPWPPVVIRAHGLARGRIEGLRRSGRRVFDATCPHVLSNQRALRRAVESGRHVYLAADPGHPETDGLLGQTAPGTVTLLPDLAAIEALEDAALKSPALLLAQTTYSRRAFSDMAARLRARVAALEVLERSICQATDLRQEETQRLAGVADALVVVGGRESANTRRLAEIGQQAGKPTFHVETADELEPAAFDDCRVVAVTAGASTPQWITRTVVERLEGFGASGWRRAWVRVGLWATRWRLSTAVGGLGLAAGMTALVGGEPGRWGLLAVAALYAWSAHLANRRRGAEPESPAEGRWRWGCAVAAGLAAVVLTWEESAGRLVLPVTAAVAALGGLLAISWFYALWTMGRREEPAADKDLYAAFGVTVAAGIAAALSGGAFGGWHRPTAALAVAAWYGFTLIFAKSVLLDLRDIAGDHLVGDRTWPVRLGRNRARRLVAGLFLALIFGPLVLNDGVWPRHSWLMGVAGWAGLWLLPRMERVRADRHARWLADGLMALPAAAAWVMS